MSETTDTDTLLLAGKTYESGTALKQRLRIGETTLENYIKDGKIPTPIRIGRRRYFDRTEVDEYLMKMPRG